ncbi:MAG: hypothetical protein O6761_06905 [Thaumarchaeota archaeon]|nr:hypothetical protein [Nitrososphaerota archaeon]
MAVIPILKQKRALASRGYQVDQNLHDGVSLTNPAYDDTNVSRVYDIRGFAEISAVFRGGDDPSTFSIKFSSKDFDDVSELDAFDFEEIAEDVDQVPLTDIIVPALGSAPNRLKNLVLTSDRKAVLVRLHQNGVNTNIFGDITLTR